MAGKASCGRKTYTLLACCDSGHVNLCQFQSELNITHVHNRQTLIFRENCSLTFRTQFKTRK